MGFTDLTSATASFLCWYEAVITFDFALSNEESISEEFSSLPGDKDAKATSYGPEVAAAPAAAADEEDDDVDLFGSDDEEVDEEAEKLKQQRLAEYAAKKAAKGPKPAAKSIVTLDVKPWDDETNLDELLENVKAVEMEGLVWGGHQFLAVGFGIKKLQINCVVEDDKVSLDDLQQAIEEDEDHVQSTDIAAMQKL
ncbi:translation elongation factor 1 subunit beta [Sugiyamaella lignohabitans]|uniref:Translation elongation factor 1 subunit beta n=1 Tax=Sugiyamaella lignohabitans TaxID=796027 RepID=A0A167FWI8_9ASCO|nr:translation elongation factor 1 subunit beta [Sugiyamaella lignohabitans]ANB15791.1 translation elongation factor 1 subunit beta [Sugiyamaella lignohabitans]